MCTIYSEKNVRFLYGVGVAQVVHELIASAAAASGHQCHSQSDDVHHVFVVRWQTVLNAAIVHHLDAVRGVIVNAAEADVGDVERQLLFFLLCLLCLETVGGDVE